MAGTSGRGKLSNVIYPQSFKDFAIKRIILSEYWTPLNEKKTNEETGVEEEVPYGHINIIHLLRSPQSNISNELMIQTPRLYCPFPPSEGFKGRGLPSLLLQYPNDWEAREDIISFHTFICNVLHHLRQWIIDSATVLSIDDIGFLWSFFNKPSEDKMGKYPFCFYGKINYNDRDSLSTQFFQMKGSEHRRLANQLSALPNKCYVQAIINLRWIFKTVENEGDCKYKIRVDIVQGLVDEIGLGQSKKKLPCVIFNQNGEDQKDNGAKPIKRKLKKNPFDKWTLEEEQSAQVVIPLKQSQQEKIKIPPVTPTKFNVKKVTPQAPVKRQKTKECVINKGDEKMLTFEEEELSDE